MNVGSDRASGQLADMGWGEAEDRPDGYFDRATESAVLLVVVGAYWGSVWLLSGLAPLAFVASHWPGRSPTGPRTHTTRR